MYYVFITFFFKNNCNNEQNCWLFETYDNISDKTPALESRRTEADYFSCIVLFFLFTWILKFYTSISFLVCVWVWLFVDPRVNSSVNVIGYRVQSTSMTRTHEVVILKKNFRSKSTLN